MREIVMVEKNQRYLVFIMALLLGVSLGFSVFNPIAKRSLLLDGSLSETYYRGAKSSEERGDVKDAKHDYEFALWLNPYHKEAREALQKLEK